MEINPLKHYAVFGRREDDPEWKETLLLSDAIGSDVKKMLPVMESEGWIEMRVLDISEYEKPNFAKTVNV